MSSSSEAHPPREPTVEPAVKSCVSGSTVPTSLGTLSILPRELRDEIYRYLIRTKYYIDNRPFQPRDEGGAIKVMLNMSKSIRQEILAVIAAEASFELLDASPGEMERWTREDILFIDQIQKIEYNKHTFMLRGQDWRDRSLLAAGPISPFVGQDVRRTSCVIKLGPLTPEAVSILESPFFKAIADLRGFKNVVLCLWAYPWDWCPEYVMKYLGGASYTDNASSFKKFVDRLSSTLEPSLGPGVISEAEVDDRKFFRDRRGWKVTSRPCDFILKQKKAKAELGTQDDEGNEPIS